MTGEDVFLAIERQMVAKLADDDLRNQSGAGDASRDRPLRGRRTRHPIFAVAARVLRPHVLVHFQLRRDVFENPGDLLADPVLRAGSNCRSSPRPANLARADGAVGTTDPAHVDRDDGENGPQSQGVLPGNREERELQPRRAESDQTDAAGFLPRQSARGDGREPSACTTRVPPASRHARVEAPRTKLTSHPKPGRVQRSAVPSRLHVARTPLHDAPAARPACRQRATVDDIPPSRWGVSRRDPSRQLFYRLVFVREEHC